MAVDTTRIYYDPVYKIYYVLDEKKQRVPVEMEND